ncbi:uncharacterized mitochondrial protein-like protein [Tanacetum coccineum]
MEHQFELTDTIPHSPHDSPLPGVNTPGSDEGSLELKELMDLVTKLTQRVLALEQSKIDQDLVIFKLQKKIKRLEKALRASTPGMKLFKIGTSRRKDVAKENVSKQGRKTNKTKPMFEDSDFEELVDEMENVEGGCIAEQVTTDGDTLNTASISVSTAGPSTVSTAGPFEDEMNTIADTLVAIRSARPRKTSLVIHNIEEEPRRATSVPTVQTQYKGKCKMVEPEPAPKTSRKAQIQLDEELAQRLFAKEQAQFEREQRIAKERAAEQEAKNVELIEQMEDARFLVETIAARKKFFASQRAVEIRSRPPTRTQLKNQMITYLKHMELEGQRLKRQVHEALEEPSKRQKIEEASGSVAEQLEEKILSEEELQNLLVVVPVEEIYVEALQVKFPIIDWEDLVRLWELVKERFIKNEPTDDKEKELWVELKRLFEPDGNDTMWKLQRYMHDPLIWKLYDTCGVHHVPDTINELIEKAAGHKLDLPSTSCIITEDAGQILDVDMITDEQKHELHEIINETKAPNVSV